MTKRKFIIIGIDGCRPDCLLKANTPNVDSLIPQSTYCFHAQTEIQTISGAAWTSLLTGVHSDKHKVFDNNFDPRDPVYETIFKNFKDSNPELKIIAHSNWKPILTKIFEKGVADVSSSGSDKKMAYRMAKDIEKGKGDLHFIQLDEVDGAGHQHTYSVDSPKYLAKIEEIDGYVGKILASIRNRPSDEEWLIIVMSDHGGSGKSHGMANLDCLEVIFIISGKAVKATGEIPWDEDEFPFIVDIVPTIAKFMELSVKEEWDGEIRGGL